MKNPVSVKKNCLCTAYDTDTVAAVAGGLAGLYYGYTNIPEEWPDKIQRRNWIEQMCKGNDSEPLSL